MNGYKTNATTPLTSLPQMLRSSNEVSEVSLKIGKQVLNDLERLASRAMDLSGLVEVTFDPIVKPLAPHGDNSKGVAQESFMPSYFGEMQRLTESISASLDRIESIVARSQI